MMILTYILLAVLLQSVVFAAADTTSASRQLTSTVGGRNDPEVTVSRVANIAARLMLQERRSAASCLGAGARMAP